MDVISYGADYGLVGIPGGATQGLLGTDGLWMMDTLHGYARKRMGGQAASQNAERTA